MKIVKESINFERNVNSPLDKMDIGKNYSDQKFIEDHEWYFKLSGIKRHQFIELIRDYHGVPILILKENASYVAISGRPQLSSLATFTSDYWRSKESALKEVKEKIDFDYIKLLPESVNFERSGDTFDKLKIGKSQSDIEFIKNHSWYYTPNDAEFVLLERNYRSEPFIIYKRISFSSDTDVWYFGISEFHQTSNCYTIRGAVKEIKEWIDLDK